MKEKTTSVFWSSVYPWIAISLCAGFLIYRYILQVSPTVITHELMLDFHVDATGLGNLAATFFYTYTVVQIFSGVILDRFNVRLVTSLAILICGIGAYAFAHSHTLLGAQLSRAFIGIGVAFATVSYMKVAAIWFKPTQFAFVGGLLATAAMFGAVLGEAPVSALIGHFGWRGSLQGIGIAGIILAGLFVMVIRDHRRLTHVTGQENQSQHVTWRNIVDVITSKDNWLLTLYSGLAFAPIAVFGGLWGVPFLKEAYGLSRNSSAALSSMCFVGLMFGGPLIGFISDRLRRRKIVIIVASAISFICLTAAVYLPHAPVGLLYVLLFIYGFTTGAFMLGFVVGKEINLMLLAATVISMINTGDAFFGAITQPIIGQFLDLGWDGVMKHGVRYYSVADFHMAFLLFSGYLLLAFIIALFIKDSRPE